MSSNVYVSMDYDQLLIITKALQTRNKTHLSKTKKDRINKQSDKAIPIDNYVDIKMYTDANGRQCYYVAPLNPVDDIYNEVIVKASRTPFDENQARSAAALVHNFQQQAQITQQTFTQPQTLPPTYQQPQELTQPFPQPQTFSTQQTYVQ